MSRAGSLALLSPPASNFPSPEGSVTESCGVRPVTLTVGIAAKTPGPPFWRATIPWGANASSRLFESAKERDASPWRPIRIWKKSPSVRSPFWPPMRVNMLPRWTKCSLARIGAVNVGGLPWPFSVWAMYMLQSQTDAPAGGVDDPSGQESGPFWPTGAMPGVPIQAMFTRPSSPAAAQANTLLCRVPWGELSGMLIGADQVVPSSVEKAYLRTVSPVTLPVSGSVGACSHTT